MSNLSTGFCCYCCCCTYWLKAEHIGKKREKKRSARHTKNKTTKTTTTTTTSVTATTIHRVLTRALLMVTHSILFIEHVKSPKQATISSTYVPCNRGSALVFVCGSPAQSAFFPFIALMCAFFFSKGPKWKAHSNTCRACSLYAFRLFRCCVVFFRSRIDKCSVAANLSYIRNSFFIDFFLFRCLSTVSPLPFMWLPLLPLLALFLSLSYLPTVLLNGGVLELVIYAVCRTRCGKTCKAFIKKTVYVKNF